MYASERHEVIAGMVRQRGRVSVTDVAGEFGVTTETVRRDLGCTLVLVTHNRNLAQRAEQRIPLDRGHLLPSSYEARLR